MGSGSDIFQGCVAHHSLLRLQIREAVGDMDVCGLRVPKGTWLHVAVCAIQRDPNVWRQPVRKVVLMHAQCAGTRGDLCSTGSDLLLCIPCTECSTLPAFWLQVSG